MSRYYILNRNTYYSEDGTLPAGARWETEADVRRWRRVDQMLEALDMTEQRPAVEDDLGWYADDRYQVG